MRFQITFECFNKAIDERVIVNEVLKHIMTEAQRQGMVQNPGMHGNTPAMSNATITKQTVGFGPNK